MKRKPVTASDLIDALRKDTDHVAHRKAQDDAIAKKEIELKEAEQPLLRDIRQAGVDISSVWDLVASQQPYPSALPVLLDHLQRQYPSPIREGIARALAVPSAAFGWNTLVHLFRNEQEVRVKDGIAVALAATVDKASIGELIQLANDPSNGPSRNLLLLGLARSQAKQAKEALRSFASDPILAPEAQRILGHGPKEGR